jgi:glycosyltransferase involved in cell wall biosynthesis
VPNFSVVIPTYRRPDRLRSCLDGFSRLNYPRHRFEIIVVDDGSPEPPDGIISRWGDHLDLKIICQPNAGPAAARNHGARHAKFTCLAFIDDDCIPRPEWLESLRTAFDAAPDHLIGGHTINALPQNPFSSASQELVDYLCGYFDGRDGRTRLFTSNNMAVRADHFHAAGGFDARFPRAAGEDREFCDRWLAQGRGTTLARGAIVMHAHSLTLRTFWRQHLDYGRGAASFRRARAARRGDAVRVEPMSFYLGLLKFPFNAGVTSDALGMWILFVVAQLANAIGFLSSRHDGPKNAEAGTGRLRVDTPPPVGSPDDLEKLPMMRDRNTGSR